MKPGHIRVFDGLRVTTEHIEHLQGSFHSAIEDIRSVVGLGKVLSGFEVVKEGNNAITVRPGLAFDAAKNRIVCDDPKTVDVSFETGEKERYVCVKYQQVEGGFVEERPTLIWDSCAVLIRASQPDPSDNLVVVAILARQGDGDAFEVIAPSSSSGEEDSAVKELAEDEERATGQTTQDSERSEPAAKPIIVNEPRDSSEDFPEISGNTDLLEAPASDESASAASNSGAEVPAASPRARLQVMQGISRLEGKGQDIYLSTLILESLKQRSIHGNNNGREEQLRFMLDKQEIELDFLPATLACQTMIDADFERVDRRVPTESGVGDEANIVEGRYSFQSTSQGDATFFEGGVLQFGMSMVHAHLNGDRGTAPFPLSQLTDKGIALLKLPGFFIGTINDEFGSIFEILQHLELIVMIEEQPQAGFKLVCRLLWTGDATEEMIENIERQNVRFKWRSVVAWKAIGNQYRHV